MNIVQVIHRVDNPSAGTSYSVTNLSTAMSARDHEVRVLALESAPESWPRGAALKVYANRFPDVVGLSWPMMRDLRKWSREPSIIHGHGLWRPTNLFPAFLPPTRSAKILVSPRGMASSYTFEKHPLGKPVWWHLLQKPGLAAVDCFHATARSEYEDIRAAGLEQPVCIIPNGIDIPPLSRPEKPEQRRLLFLSRINHKKGLDMLLRIWRRLQDSFTDWDLIIAGPLGSDYAKTVMKEAETLGCRRVVFPGELLNEAKARVFAESDLFILPTYSENFGLVVAEALSHRVPVVTTRGAPWQGLETHRCGWWTPIHDEVIHAALSESMTMPSSELAEMGSRGRRWMERDYSWPRIAEMTETTYEWLLHGASRPSWVV